jgi:NYN domain
MSRMMVFVDGENLTIRAQELAKGEGLKLERHPPCYLKDVFVWFPALSATMPFQLLPNMLFRAPATRAYYYTSVVGDDPRVNLVREQLRALDFDPQVFKKPSGNAKSKGVDITLTKDMLAHAFEDHYDIALLFAGDGDYIPLIEEVKRRGKNVHVCFFAAPGLGLSPEIPIVADKFFDLTEPFLARWRAALG